eukprot:g4551.t1
MRGLSLCAALVLLALGRAAADVRDTAEPPRPELWTWLSGSQDAALAQLTANRDIVTHVSLGGYSVGADLSLSGKGPNRTILSQLKSYGINVHPLIGGGDIKTLRALFSNSTATAAFVAEAVARATSLGLAGFNIDFEPYSGNEPTTYADALLFAKFANALAKGLHESGTAKLSIDYFSNLAFWDISLLNYTTEVDYLISMDT